MEDIQTMKKRLENHKVQVSRSKKIYEERLKLPWIEEARIKRDKYEEDLYKMVDYLEEMSITYIDDDEVHIWAEKKLDDVFADVSSIGREFDEYEQKVKAYKRLNLKPCMFKIIPSYKAWIENRKAKNEETIQTQVDNENEPVETVDHEKFEDKLKSEEKIEETKNQLIKELDVLMHGKSTFQAAKEKEELPAHVAEKKQTIKSEKITDEDENEATQKQLVQNGETKDESYHQQRNEDMETLDEPSFIERYHMNATCFILRKHTEMEFNGTKYVLGPISSNKDDAEENDPESNAHKEETSDAMGYGKAEDNSKLKRKDKENEKRDKNNLENLATVGKEKNSEDIEVNETDGQKFTTERKLTNNENNDVGTQSRKGLPNVRNLNSKAKKIAGRRRNAKWNLACRILMKTRILMWNKNRKRLLK